MASGVFRIAHISDTHVSPEYNRHNIRKLKGVLAYVVDMAYDHVAITGDITGHGESRDFRSIRRLLKYFDLLNYDRLTVTIGNHDVFGGVHKAEDLVSFRRHCKITPFDLQIAQFERAFRETFPKKAFENESLFPFVKILGPVALIGMNSIRAFHPILNPVGSNGAVFPGQIESARKILDHPLVAGLQKIVLIHHHFGSYDPHSTSFSGRIAYMIEGLSLRQFGKKRLEDFLSDHGVSAVLHGHTHVEGFYNRSGIKFSSTALNPMIPRSIKLDGGMLQRTAGAPFNEIAIHGGGKIEMTRMLVIDDERRVTVHVPEAGVLEQIQLEPE